MAKVTIDGQEFTLGNERVQDLMQWLQGNGGVKTEGATPGDFSGQQLLNETTPKPANTTIPRSKDNPDGTGSYDFGTTWI